MFELGVVYRNITRVAVSNRPNILVRALKSVRTLNVQKKSISVEELRPISPSNTQPSGLGC
ncbi:MAG: hypothetical protein HGA73_01005 [Syntrophaceae bacterium]|nr:hypothetical protein [Syntrophaceae bacterium]